MSIKLHYLFCHLDHFLKTVVNMSEEQEKSIHQDIKVMEERYQDQWDTHMMADYCWCLMQDCSKKNYKRKSFKRTFLHMSSINSHYSQHIMLPSFSCSEMMRKVCNFQVNCLNVFLVECCVVSQKAQSLDLLSCIRPASNCVLVGVNLQNYYYAFVTVLCLSLSNSCSFLLCVI